ncbi:MAG TPA: hypothetical protein VFI78_00680 [Salinimicrobium sp.]|nr:hypothetical protein [Salinimicrobium sp.]
MKINFNYIKGILLLAAIAFLFLFAEKRNSKRVPGPVNLAFTNSENLYVTEKAVNKLLIQNYAAVQGEGKEPLDLNEVESLLDAHKMIENAEVFLSINGQLGAIITQRKPIARVMAPEPYYIDRQGVKMPLSPYHSARVPLVRGIKEENLKEVFPLLDFIVNDGFLSRQVIGVQRKSHGVYQFQIRETDFVVILGKIKDLERKFKNFKAFYKQALKDKKLKAYKKVNLRFGNQVVCTKK